MYHKNMYNCILLVDGHYWSSSLPTTNKQTSLNKPTSQLKLFKK